jgi:exoribonuclease R
LFDKNAAKEGVLKQIAEHISVTERNSADAERDSKDVKLFAFLKAQLASGEPQKYPARVTDVRNFGFFVDVPGLAMSGLVPLSTIEEDFYVFDEARRNLVRPRRQRDPNSSGKISLCSGPRCVRSAEKAVAASGDQPAKQTSMQIKMKTVITMARKGSFNDDD